MSWIHKCKNNSFVAHQAYQALYNLVKEKIWYGNLKQKGCEDNI